MKKDDGIIGIVFAAFSLIFFIMALPFGFYGKDGLPAAGFFPLLTSGILLIISITLAVQGFRSQDKDGYWKLESHQLENRRAFFLTIAGVAVFLLIWKWINFAIGAYLLALFLNWVYRQKWKFNLVFTIVFVTILIICFEKIMMVQFSI